jgi:hypothetical protein
MEWNMDKGSREGAKGANGGREAMNASGGPRGGRAVKPQGGPQRGGSAGPAQGGKGGLNETTLAIIVFGIMGIVFVGMIGLLIGYFLFMGGSGGGDYVPPQDVPGGAGNGTSDSGGSSSVDTDMTERVNAIAERIEGIEGINSGARFGLFIGSDGYTVGKISSGIYVIRGVDDGTDFDIYLPSEETFEEIENAPDVCEKMRELRDSGEITAVMHVSEMQLFFKGYLSIESCLR